MKFVQIGRWIGRRNGRQAAENPGRGRSNPKVQRPTRDTCCFLFIDDGSYAENVCLGFEAHKLPFERRV